MFFNQLAARSHLVPTDKQNKINAAFLQIIPLGWGEKNAAFSLPIAVIQLLQ